MSQPCQRCEQPTDGLICSTCLERYIGDLGKTRWLIAQLETVATRQTRYGTAGGGRIIGKTLPLPVDLRAGDDLDDYRAALVDAVRRLERNRDHWPAALVDPHASDERVAIAAARWLAVRARAVTIHADGPDIVAGVDKAFKGALRTINRPLDHWYAGPCMFGDPPCPADLYATIGSATVKCTKCGEHFDVQGRREYLRQEAEDQNMNAANIARAVSWLGTDDVPVALTAARIRQWAHRKRLLVKAIDRCDAHIREIEPPTSCKRCQPLYRVGDAIDLLASDTRRRAHW